MNLLNTEFGRFLWRVFIIIIFLGIMFLIIKVQWHHGNVRKRYLA